MYLFQAISAKPEFDYLSLQIDVLELGFGLSSFGVNFKHVCCKGTIAPVPSVRQWKTKVEKLAPDNTLGHLTSASDQPSASQHVTKAGDQKSCPTPHSSFIAQPDYIALPRTIVTSLIGLKEA